MPLLGFFLLPWTTLAYAWMWANGTNEVSGFEYFIVILAFLFDLSSYAGGQHSRSNAWKGGGPRSSGALR